MFLGLSHVTLNFFQINSRKSHQIWSYVQSWSGPQKPPVPRSEEGNRWKEISQSCIHCFFFLDRSRETQSGRQWLLGAFTQWSSIITPLPSHRALITALVVWKRIEKIPCWGKRFAPACVHAILGSLKNNIFKITTTTLITSFSQLAWSSDTLCRIFAKQGKSLWRFQLCWTT